MSQISRPLRVGIYARVSTTDRQDPETQLRQLREYASWRKFEVVKEYVDRATGKMEERSNYRALMSAAYRREFDVVLVWRYDRFARSTQALINALKTFQVLGIDFISYQENIDTTTPQGEMVFTFMASLAQFESSLISERVKAGMARAKAQGKPVSRPTISAELQRQIKVLHNENISINQIGKRLGISYGTAWNYVQRLQKEASVESDEGY